MKDNILSCREARQIDMVGYLAQLGYHPQKVHGTDHWYLSPFRHEKTASFKVNQRLNIWYDHAEGRGGDLIDFGTKFHRCTIPELLNRLSQYRAETTFLFQTASPSGFPGAGEKEGSPRGKIVILKARPLTAQPLIDYLLKRNIPPDIAARSCQEVDFTLYDKQQTVIGFVNRSGGYELRSEHFKGSSSPKDISFFDNRTSEIAVFEGFFNYLSFQTINRGIQAPMTNSLVLNSLAFLEKSRSLMEQYNRIHLLLDRDTAGSTSTRMALQWNPDKYIDRSDFYQGHKDLNEWLIHERPRQLGLNQSRRKGRSI
jgi:CHC2 zinc finger/Toprim-like